MCGIIGMVGRAEVGGALYDALNLLQVKLLQRLRQEPDDEAALYAIHLTINGISAGLRNSG